MQVGAGPLPVLSSPCLFGDVVTGTGDPEVRTTRRPVSDPSRSPTPTGDGCRRLTPEPLLCLFGDGPRPHESPVTKGEGGRS